MNRPALDFLSIFETTSNLSIFRVCFKKSLSQKIEGKIFNSVFKVFIINLFKVNTKIPDGLGLD